MPCALKISEAASLAMHAIGLVATHSGPSLSVKRIASSFNVSEAHLSKVMQRLVKVGLLRSVRGPKGGFSLARDSGAITLLDVFEAIEGPVESSICTFGVDDCDGKHCVLGRVLFDANQMLLDHLSRTSLNEIRDVFSDRAFTAELRRAEREDAGD